MTFVLIMAMLTIVVGGVLLLSVLVDSDLMFGLSTFMSIVFGTIWLVAFVYSNAMEQHDIDQENWRAICQDKNI